MDIVSSLLDRALRGDKHAERDLTIQVILPLLDAAVTKQLLRQRFRRHEKQDVIQEVFGYLYENRWAKLRTFNPVKGKLAPWLWALTSNWLYDHTRKKPDPEPMADPESELVPDSGPEGKVELGRLIDKLAEELDEEELALFQWLYQDGVSPAVAAMRLQIDVETLYKRKQRLEKKVRALLLEKGGA